jgi:hypothetical protein
MMLCAQPAAPGQPRGMHTIGFGRAVQAVAYRLIDAEDALSYVQRRPWRAVRRVSMPR